MDILRHRQLVKESYKDRYESDKPFKIPKYITAPVVTTVKRTAEATTDTSARQPTPLPIPPQHETMASAIFPRTPSKNRTIFQPASPALSEASAYTASAAGTPTKTPRSRYTVSTLARYEGVYAHVPLVVSQTTTSNPYPTAGYDYSPVSYISHALHCS